jgi:hypothetical protein
VELDRVAGEGEIVDLAPHHGEGGERLDEGPAAEAAEAVASVGADAPGGGVEAAGHAQRAVGVELQKPTLTECRRTARH